MRRRLSIYREFLVACLTFLTAVAWAQPQITYKINTLAGSRVIENGIQAVQAQLNRPGAVAVDGSGNLYIADSRNNSVRKVDSTGTITTVAGTGEYGFGGDGGPAVQALLRDPAGVAVDEAGNLYIADRENLRIRKVDSTGTITTVAGAGKYGSAVDTGPAVQAQLRSPAGVAVDGAGNLYIADSGRGRVFKVDSTGTITTVAGGLALEDRIGRPTSVAVDNAGNLYIAESLYNRIFKVDSTGTIATVVGASAQARLRYPTGVAVDNADNLYIADRNNHRILKVDVTGTIDAVAGTGESGFSGDNGAAATAQLSYPSGVAVDGAGNLYIADTGNVSIRKVDSTGTLTTVTDARGYNPSIGVAVDGAGNLYIADTHRIRKVDATGTITTVAGASDISSYAGDGGPAAVLELTYTAHDMAPFARDMGYVDKAGKVKSPFTWDEARRLHLRAKLDAVFFHLYGVTDRDDIRYIYSTFPIVEREEKAVYGGVYRSCELCLAYMNALADGNPDAEVRL